MRFELCVPNLIWKREAKDLEKKKKPSIFHLFWNKEVHNKEHPGKKTLMFECYNILDPME
jgi:hypothetical protein